MVQRTPLIALFVVCMLAFAPFSWAVFTVVYNSITSTLNPDGNYYMNPTSHNIRIDFNITDDNFVPGTDDLNFSIYLSKASGDKNYTVVADMNANRYCGSKSAVAPGADYSTVQYCYYDWNTAISGAPDGNWSIDINAYTRLQAGGTDINIGTAFSGVDKNFFLDLTVPTSSITQPVNGATLFACPTQANIILTSTDTNVGSISKFFLRFNTGAWINNGTTTTYTYTPTGEATTTFDMVATDHADNNATTKTITMQLKNCQASQGGGTGQGAYCGDNKCNGFETIATCPNDCAPVCGDNLCTGSETVESCPADCTLASQAVCGDDICQAVESCSTCSLDCGSCAEQVVFQKTFDAQPSPSTITSVLTQAGLGENAIASALQAPQYVSVSRAVEVVQATTTDSYITLYVQNTTQNTIKGVRVVEFIPKSVAESASLVDSSTPFNVLVEDPIVEFIVGDLSPGESAQVEYVLTDSPVNASNAQDFVPPMVSSFQSAEDAANACKNISCNDSNPCTTDQCFEGTCTNTRVPDGTSCGYGLVCSSGACVSRPTGPAGQAGAQDNSLLIAVIAVVIILGAGAYYFSKSSGKKRR
ncbi:MAG: hypothetical protein HY393_02815 [Candidatus Diapherotrites archaeon]|nr:hypothetical protein [Candidatus Diapherotrites archaeon]